MESMKETGETSIYFFFFFFAFLDRALTLALALSCILDDLPNPY